MKSSYFVNLGVNFQNTRIIKGTISRCSARANLICLLFSENTTDTCRVMPTSFPCDMRDLYPACRSLVARWKTRGRGPGVWNTRGLVENTGSQWKTRGLSAKHGGTIFSPNNEVEILLFQIAMNINRRETRFCEQKQASTSLIFASRLRNA